MKKLIGVLCFALILGFSSVAQAQEKKDTGITHEVKKAAKKAGDKTSEVASKGKAEVTDQVYKGKIGPDGQKIYIDNHSKYYWIDDKGKRHYVKGKQLKSKP